MDAEDKLYLTLKYRIGIKTNLLRKVVCYVTEEQAEYIGHYTHENFRVYTFSTGEPGIQLLQIYSDKPEEALEALSNILMELEPNHEQRR